MMRWKIIGCPCMQNILCRTKYSTVQKLSNKQSAKVICRFDRLKTSHSKRQKSQMSIEKLSSAHTFNYIVLKVNPGLTSCEEFAMALQIMVNKQPLFKDSNIIHLSLNVNHKTLAVEDWRIWQFITIHQIFICQKFLSYITDLLYKAANLSVFYQLTQTF